MKKIIVGLAIALGLAASIQEVRAQDAKAKAILEKVNNHVKTLKSAKANFKFDLKAGKQTQSKTGTFTMMGEKYVVQLGDQKIICDGKNIYTYAKDLNEVQISTFDPKEQSISPTKMFTNFYDKEYNYKYAGTKKWNGADVDVIELTPKTAKQFAKIQLYIKKNNMIAGGILSEKNGNTYTYSISQFESNPKVNNDLFVFDKSKYPGVDVVDLR